MESACRNININSEKIRSDFPPPSYCCFSITLKCLLQCNTCYIWKQKEDFSRELQIGNWIKFARRLPDLVDKKTDIIITGGEPLLKENILELISFCSRMGYKVSLQTNGFLVDEELAKRLRDAGLWRICISFYSLREEIHDFLRGEKGVYRKVLRAIEYLSKFAPGTGINIQNIIMDINLEDIVDMAEWVEKDGRIDYIYYLVPVLPFGAEKDESWFSNNNYRFMWPQDSIKASLILDELIDKKNYYKKIANLVSQLQIFKRYFNQSLIRSDTKCTLGSRAINIDPRGNIFLCFSQAPISNIVENNLNHIWTSQKAKETRLQMACCKKKCHFLINCSFDETNLIPKN